GNSLPFHGSWSITRTLYLGWCFFVVLLSISQPAADRPREQMLVVLVTVLLAQRSRCLLHQASLRAAPPARGGAVEPGPAQIRFSLNLQHGETSAGCLVGVARSSK